MSRHRTIGQMIPWMACAAATAGVIGTLLFALGSEPVDLGKYLGPSPQPASLQRSASADPSVVVGEGSGRMAVDPPAPAAPEAPPPPLADAEVTAPPVASPQVAPPLQDMAHAELAAASPPAPQVSAPIAPPVVEPPPVSEPTAPTVSEPPAPPVEAGPLALLSPEPPRAAPGPVVKVDPPPRTRSIRKLLRAASVSAVQRRSRPVMRRFRGPPMQTITIFHGPYIEVIRVPR